MDAQQRLSPAQYVESELGPKTPRESSWTLPRCQRSRNHPKAGVRARSAEALRVPPRSVSFGDFLQ